MKQNDKVAPLVAQNTTDDVDSKGLDDDNDENLKINLISKDEQKIEISVKDAKLSKLVKTVIEQDPTATEIPIPDISSEILQIIANYMIHHKGNQSKNIEKPLKSKIMNDVCTDPWDADFIHQVGINKKTLYDLIVGANYMDIQCLLHLGCAKVASTIKGQPLDKIKEILDDKKTE